MGPKPIQDVAPPQAPAAPPPPAAEPPSGQEMVGDIPVRMPVATNGNDAKPPGPMGYDKQPAIPLPDASKKAKDKPKLKQNRPKPVAAIVIACLAIIFLAAGAYFEFLANR